MMQKNASYANRGAFLERVIDMANHNYRAAGVADIRKVPTPFKPMSTKGGKVTGHFEKPTWVDYSGVYKGKAIIFDAKQTAQKSFPLANIHQQQYELLKSWHKNGAVAFLVVYFSSFDKYYYLPFESLEWAFKRANEGGRKSIEYSYFETNCYELRSKDGFTLHYLDVIVCAE